MSEREESQAAVVTLLIADGRKKPKDVAISKSVGGDKKFSLNITGGMFIYFKNKRYFKNILLRTL